MEETKAVNESVDAGTVGVDKQSVELQWFDKGVNAIAGKMIELVDADVPRTYQFSGEKVELLAQLIEEIKGHAVTDLVYMASPYSHGDHRVEIYRWSLACEAANKLMQEGLYIFSPIAHTHPIAMWGGLGTGWEFWKEIDRRMLTVCRSMIVLTAEGWDKSEGVKAEIEIMESWGREVGYVSPEDLDIIELSPAKVMTMDPFGSLPCNQCMN